MIDIDKLSKLPKPIEWTVLDLSIAENNLVVPVRYTIHNGNSETKGDIKITEVSFPLDKITPVVKNINNTIGEIDFIRANQLREIAARRDEICYELFKRLNYARDDSDKKSTREIFGDVEGSFLSGGGLELLKRYCFFQALIIIFSKNKREHSKEIQALLS